MPTMTLPEKLRPFLEKKKRFKIAIGGRGSGKSTGFADALIMKAQVESAKIICFREFWTSIEDSIHTLLKEEIDRIGATGFNVGKKNIDHIGGGCFRFKGLARALGSVRSTQGAKYFWIEEAQFLSDESIRELTPTVRTKDAEIWFCGNPQSSADPFSVRFINPFLSELQSDGYYEDDLHMVAFMNYNDNPWFLETSLEQERVFDFKNLDRALYDHIWLGAFNDFVEDSIIKAEWFDACIDAHIKLGFKPRGAKIVSFDPSDLGPDDKALACRHGSVLLDCKTRAFGDINEGADWAMEYAVNKRADVFTWDCDGMGVGLRRQVNDSLKNRHIDIVEFRGSNAVEDPDKLYLAPGRDDKDPDRKTNRQIFKNFRAQKYWAIRDRIYKTYLAINKGVYTDPDEMLSISSGIDQLAQLRSELCRIPRRPNANGLIQIMTKNEMKRLHKIISPNMADAGMMSCITPKPKHVDVLPERRAEAAY